MFFKKKKKRQSGVKPKQKYKIKDFFNVPILLLTLIACLFIGSFIIQMMSENNSKSYIVDLDKLLTKNLYEKETGHRIQIEILNGCGVVGLASKVSDLLRDNNIDVVRSENADNFNYGETYIIINNSNKLSLAKELIALLKINDNRATIQG